MLLNLELDGKPILQIFMLGQAEIRSLLQSDKMEQVRQRITATFHLRPLEHDETREYIVHRLVTAGWDNDPVFSEETFEAIYRFTGGTPRMINNLCDRLLLYGFLEELHVLDGEATRVVITEIEQDAHYPKADTGILRAAIPSVKPVVLGEPVQTSCGSLEDRMIRLESQIEALTHEMRKERALLRKAILIQLDLDQAYDG
jgi:hypothetical protein